MTLPELDIAVEGGDWPPLPVLETLAGKAVAAALAEAGPELMAGVGLSLLFCDDARIREINGQWRGFDKPTNVLSFPAAAPDRLAKAPLLGDIVMACETIRREAEEEDKRFEDHLAHMVVHGVLHLIGEDHETNEQAERMEALERKALARLGIADPYAGWDADA